MSASLPFEICRDTIDFIPEKPLHGHRQRYPRVGASASANVSVKCKCETYVPYP